MIRIYLYFPVNDAQETEAFSVFVDDLLSFSPNSGSQPTNVTGFTYGSDESLLTGYYWSGEEWMRDQVMLLFADFDLEEDDPRLTELTNIFKQKFFQFYTEVDRWQLAMWCVTHPLKDW